MLSMVLPRNPSLLSEDRSLGPSIVMNSSKSTWPSPAGRHTRTIGLLKGKQRQQKIWQTGMHLVLKFMFLAKTKQSALRQINRWMCPQPWQAPTHLSSKTSAPVRCASGKRLLRLILSWNCNWGNVLQIEIQQIHLALNCHYVFYRCVPLEMAINRRHLVE